MERILEDIQNQINIVSDKSFAFEDDDHFHNLKLRMLVSFLEIQRINRQMNNSTRHAKNACLEDKAQLDKLHLMIQNLNYESQYISKEINKCNSQETLFQDIELFSVQEFKELMGTSVDCDDPYALMKSRLEHELQERKRMTALLLSLKERKIEMLTKIKGKQLELEILEKDLGEVLIGTLPLQEKLGLEVTRVREKNLKAAQTLPAALFHIYTIIAGYLESNGSSLSDLEIFIDPSNENQFSQDYCCHPSNLLLNIRQDGILLGCIKFSWVLKFKIITCSIDLADSFDNVPPIFMLSNLLKGDKGLECPNSASLLYSDGVEFNADKAPGFPFFWAQILAGLSFPSLAQYIHHLSKNGIWYHADNERKIPFFEKLCISILERRKLMIKVNTVIAGLVLKFGARKDLIGRLLSIVKLPSVSKSSYTFQIYIEVQEERYGAEIILHASYPFSPCSIENICIITKDNVKKSINQEISKVLKDSFENILSEEIVDNEKLIEIQLVNFMLSISAKK